MRLQILVASTICIASISGCSRSSSGKPALTPTTSTPAPSTAPATSTAPTELTGVPEPTSTDQGTISLAANWKSFEPDFKSGWHALCLSGGDACTGSNALSGGTDSATYDSSTPQIRFEYEGVEDTSNSAAKLDLGHFALYFSSDAGSQFDFQTWVTDTMDAMPVGTVRTKSFAPLRETLEHPAEQQWILVISQA